MSNSESNLNNMLTSINENEFQGMYGPYKITAADKLEVQRYRLALLISGISFVVGVGQWILFGPKWASIWLFPMSIGLGLALQWIHIYIKPLHKALQILWLLGFLGLIILLTNYGMKELLPEMVASPVKLVVIGPIFAALTGLGFKEFFCFQRIEAIGLTVLIPCALISHLIGIFNGETIMGLLVMSSMLFLIMAIRKFGMDPSADIGDKSIFEFLDRKEQESSVSL